MRCQDFERLMLESDDRELLQEERLTLEEHLEACPGCSAFRSFRRSLREQLREAAGPALPDELSDRVRFRCFGELDSLSRTRAGRDSGRRPASVPWPIWAALLVLTGLTILFLIPGLEEFRESQKLTLESLLVLMVILQNALMLLCTPLLMRRGRLSQYRFRQFS
jgi:anti-sigma factor RsiW